MDEKAKDYFGIKHTFSYMDVLTSLHMKARVIGYRLLVIGYRLLVIGYWLLVNSCKV